MRPHDEAWRVRVTSQDVRAAAEAWWLARVSGASRERLVELWDDLLRLRRALAIQAADGEDARRVGDAQATWRADGRVRPLGGAPAPGGWTDCPAADGVVPHQR